MSLLLASRTACVAVYWLSVAKLLHGSEHGCPNMGSVDLPSVFPDVFNLRDCILDIIVTTIVLLDCVWMQGWLWL